MGNQWWIKNLIWKDMDDYIWLSQFISTLRKKEVYQRQLFPSLNWDCGRDSVAMTGIEPWLELNPPIMPIIRRSYCFSHTHDLTRQKKMACECYKWHFSQGNWVCFTLLHTCMLEGDFFSCFRRSKKFHLNNVLQLQRESILYTLWN